jgi:hypothetical protein
MASAAVSASHFRQSAGSTISAVGGAARRVLEALLETSHPAGEVIRVTPIYGCVFCHMPNAHQRKEDNPIYPPSSSLSSGESGSQVSQLSE